MTGIQPPLHFDCHNIERDVSHLRAFKFSLTQWPNTKWPYYSAACPYWPSYYYLFPFFLFCPICLDRPESPLVFDKSLFFFFSLGFCWFILMKPAIAVAVEEKLAVIFFSFHDKAKPHRNKRNNRRFLVCVLLALWKRTNDVKDQLQSWRQWSLPF